MAARSDRGALDDTKAILNRIRQLVRVLRTFDKQAQARYGFGAAQLFILHVLHTEGELSLNELADRTATDQSSASLAVGKLVNEGWVSRNTSAVDRRQVRLALTSKARAIVRKAPPAAQERIMESVREMPPTERTQLMALLDKLLAGMSGEEVASPMLFQDEPALARRGGPEHRAPRRRRAIR